MLILYSIKQNACIEGYLILNALLKQGGNILLHYNKKQQPYSVDSKFTIHEDGEKVSYCKVKFLYSRHEQIIKESLLRDGDFEDESLNVEPMIIGVDLGNKESKTVITPMSESIQTAGFTIEESQELKKDLNVRAVDPRGKVVYFKQSALQDFCEKNGLDIEVVQAVIDGKQKTHRKWRFTINE